MPPSRKRLRLSQSPSTEEVRLKSVIAFFLCILVSSKSLF